MIICPWCDNIGHFSNNWCLVNMNCLLFTDWWQIRFHIFQKLSCTYSGLNKGRPSLNCTRRFPEGLWALSSNQLNLAMKWTCNCYWLQVIVSFAKTYKTQLISCEGENTAFTKLTCQPTQEDGKLFAPTCDKQHTRFKINFLNFRTTKHLFNFCHAKRKCFITILVKNRI